MNNLLGTIDFISGNGNWNIILIVIFFCSFIGLTIFIERFLFLRRSEIDTNGFVIKLRPIVNSGNMAEAIKLAEETGGTIGNIVRSGLVKYHRPKGEIESAMEVSGMIEIAKLERNAKILSIIAHVAPLIGLLGTVLGFIQAFAEMRMSGLVDISATRIGEAMEYALITTAAGLVVAIPCVIAYNYIVSRIENFVLEIQSTSSEIVDMIVYREENYL